MFYKSNKNVGRLISGYTIVELLIVVVIIGILATIGIISYNGWNQSSTENKLKNDLNSVYAAMEAARTYSNNYPSDVNSLSDLEPSQDVVLRGGSVDEGKTYCVTAAITKNSKVISYHIDSTGAGHVAQSGACTSEDAVTTVEPPATSVVVNVSSQPNAFTTRWSWNSGSNCAIGTVIRYQYKLTISTSPLYDGGWTSNPVTVETADFTTLDEGLTYTLYVQSQCHDATNNITSGWTESGSASYFRPVLINSINVKDFGVKGDGVTDDTNNLLTAFNATISQSKTAYIPSGTYKVSSLTLPNNVSISGDGVNSWINGKILLNTGGTISNIAIGINGDTTQLVSNNPVTNLTLNSVVFKGGSSQGVFRVESEQSLSNSNFNDCVIETNPDGLSNGISIVDNGVVNSTLHDVTFTRLHIKSQPRMGFEMLGRSYLGTRTTNYYNINIVDSIIDPVGAEAISFDGPGSNLLVQGTHFKGSLTSTQYSWHQMLEFNGSSSSKAIGNTFDRAKGWWLNLHCTDCSFEDNTFDSRIDNVGIASADQAWGGGCTNCTFKNNNVTMDSGGGFFYFINSTNNLFTGNTFWDTRNPTTSCSYFQTGSSGNTMTGNTFKYKYQWYPDNNLCINISADSSINVNNNTLLSP